MQGSIRLSTIEKDNDRWISDGCVMACKRQSAGFSVDLKNSNVVSALVARIEELAARIKVETARIIAARPFDTLERQFAVGTDGEDSNTVVKSVAGVDKFTIFRNQNLRTKVAARKSGRKS